jgi:hypothetical protein
MFSDHVCGLWTAVWFEIRFYLPDEGKKVMQLFPKLCGMLHSDNAEGPDKHLW